jgi:hypothetical protein
MSIVPPVLGLAEMAVRDLQLKVLIQRRKYSTTIDVSYAALQAHGIVNVAHHREYSIGIVFIFSQGRKYLYHV